MILKAEIPFLTQEVQRMTRDHIPTERISAPWQLYFYFFLLLGACRYPVSFLLSGLYLLSVKTLRDLILFCCHLLLNIAVLDLCVPLEFVSQ